MSRTATRSPKALTRFCARITTPYYNRRYCCSGVSMRIGRTGGFVLLLLSAAACRAEVMENRRMRVELAADGTFVLTDKASKARWEIHPPRVAGKTVRVSGIAREGEALRFDTAGGITFELKLSAEALDYSFSPEAGGREVRLLDRSLALGPGERNYLAVPHRLGILLPVSGEKSYSRVFRAYETGRG